MAARREALRHLDPAIAVDGIASRATTRTDRS
jgi:hypothetical protein